MKKRAKQLAMLGLTVTMMCGTQMTAFASGLGEEAPVAIETEAKATASEETEEVKVEAKEEKADAKEEVKTEVKEEVVTGTEVAETPVVEETEVKETVAGTEELVGLGVSTEAEAKTEAPAEKEDAVEDAVPTTAPQADVEANADTNTEVEEQTSEAETEEVTGEITGINFPTASGGVVTLTDKDFEAIGSYEVAEVPVSVNATASTGSSENIHTFIAGGSIGICDVHDEDNDGTFDGSISVSKADLVAAGGTKVLSGTCNMTFVDQDAHKHKLDTLDCSVTVKYVADGTVTPEPEKPQPEPEKPQPDGGNGGTETPDPEKDGWIKTDEGWKYYENGQKVTGWKAVSEKWYYFNENGIMETGWASVSGHWYYLNADGSMATGWVSVGGHWYYLNEDGTMASNQWIDGWYVDASGKML